MHLIPRNHGDPFRTHGRKPGDPERLEEIAKQLREVMEIA
jgi:diadenosine tetraphosphate (Ap4A) HIT family hydrolase